MGKWFSTRNGMIAHGNLFGFLKNKTTISGEDDFVVDVPVRIYYKSGSDTPLPQMPEFVSSAAGKNKYSAISIIGDELGQMKEGIFIKQKKFGNNAMVNVGENDTVVLGFSNGGVNYVYVFSILELSSAEKYHLDEKQQYYTAVATLKYMCHKTYSWNIPNGRTFGDDSVYKEIIEAAKYKLDNKPRHAVYVKRWNVIKQLKDKHFDTTADTVGQFEVKKMENLEATILKQCLTGHTNVPYRPIIVKGHKTDDMVMVTVQVLNSPSKRKGENDDDICQINEVITSFASEAFDKFKEANPNLVLAKDIDSFLEKPSRVSFMGWL